MRKTQREWSYHPRGTSFFLKKSNRSAWNWSRRSERTEPRHALRCTLQLLAVYNYIPSREGIVNPLSISNTFHLIRIASDKKLIRFTSPRSINKLTVVIWRIVSGIRTLYTKLKLVKRISFCKSSQVPFYLSMKSWLYNKTASLLVANTHIY